MSTLEIPTIEDILGGEVSAGFDPLPIDTYNAVITDVEIKDGKTSKIPYFNVTATIFEGEFKGKKSWGISSFSPKAVSMPGGVTQLLQSAGVSIGDVPKGMDQGETRAWLAIQLKSTPIEITTGLDQAVKNGVNQENPDGTPKMRDFVDTYAPASEEFLAGFQNEVDGVDDDVPF